MLATVILVIASVLLLASVVLAIVAPDRAWLRLLMLVFGLGPWLLVVWAIWAVVAHRGAYSSYDLARDEVQAMNNFDAYCEGVRSMYKILSGSYYMLFALIGFLLLLYGIELFRSRMMRRQIDALKRAAVEQ